VSEANRQPGRTLDEYLDGVAGDGASLPGERPHPVDAATGEEIRLQGEIDRSLKRLFDDTAGRSGAVAPVPALDSARTAGRIGRDTEEHGRTPRLAVGSLQVYL